MSSRLTVLVPAVALAVLCTGCFGLTTGIHFEDPRRFSPRPDETHSIEPVAKVNQYLWGLYVFSFRVKDIEPEGLRERYLANENYRITNWQVTVNNIDIPYLDFILTVPYARVIFDVVEVKKP